FLDGLRSGEFEEELGRASDPERRARGERLVLFDPRQRAEPREVAFRFPAQYCNQPGDPDPTALLDLVGQLIAQLLDVAGAHQEDEVVGADEFWQRLLRPLEGADVVRLRD